MDKKTMKALKEEEYPNIEYSLLSFGDVVKTDNNFTAKATGNLSVAGTTKKVSLNITGTQLKNGNIEITGSKDMKMTDFNIDPPTALLGTMRTRDEITIEFKIVLDNHNIESQPD
jgi:polyisoprenoid-binding protein YceI